MIFFHFKSTDEKRRKKFLILFVTLSIATVTGICEGTNWHCYYTNCLYVFVPEVMNSETVTSAKVEVSILKRKERFGTFTNTVPHKTKSIKLENAENGFCAYLYFGAEQHRLWEQFEVGICEKKLCFSKTKQKLFRHGSRHKNQ